MAATLPCTSSSVLVAQMAFAFLLVCSSSSLTPFFPQAANNQGFVSIDCGGSANYTASDTGIRWTSDRGLINTGYSAQTTLTKAARCLETVRYFPSLKKNCYILDVEAGNRYLVRATFAYGNYDGKNEPPSFQYIVGATMIGKVNASVPVVYEIILFALVQTLSICIERSDISADTPFISALELRSLAANMYTIASADKYLMKVYRINFGASKPTSIRLPSDKYDRVWEADSRVFGKNKTWQNLQTKLPVTTDVTESPPGAVMETAITTTNATSMELLLTLSNVSQNYTVYIYFAEIINLTLKTRSFDIFINNNLVRANINLESQAGLLNTLEYSGVFSSVSGAMNISLARTLSSDLAPIVNALEVYSLSSFATTTLQQDVNAINSFKDALNLLQWTGDPCRPYPWEWVTCSSSVPNRITGVNLLSMGLRGTIDPAIASLSSLVFLSLADNNLTGSIPDMGQLVQLQTLQLQDNKLIGHIPESLATLPRLQQLFLEDNQLDGILPQGLENRSGLDVRLYGNPLLCTSAGTCFGPPPSGAPADMVSSKMRRFWASTGSILASAIIATLSMLVTACVSFMLWRIRRRSTALKSVCAINTDKMIKGTSNLTKTVRIFNLDEIIAATGNLSTKVGEGAFGSVYYGQLTNGQEVAVKVHSGDSLQGEREFLNEVEFLSRVHHRNVVALIGYYHSVEERILIYEYMKGGNLEEQIFAYNDASRLSPPLPWKQRLNIALDAARGLVYLHQDCYPSIIHRDVKSCNILLTENMVAKVADFGLSKLGPGDGDTHVVTAVRGTSGYVDPEYYETEQLTQKSDVYSFGVLLLEMLSGREPLMSDTTRTHVKLCDWARDHLQEGRLVEMVDPAIGRDYNQEAMWRVAETAMTCVEPSSANRPVMAEVLQELQEARDLELGKKTVPVASQRSPMHQTSPSHWQPCNINQPDCHYSQPIYSKNSLTNTSLKSRPTL